MNIFSKISEFIKNIFSKNKAPVLASAETENKFPEIKTKKPVFMEEYRKKMAKVETLVHDGSGLGIEYEVKY